MKFPAIGAVCAAVSLVLFSTPSTAAPRAALTPAVFGTAVLSTNTTPYDARWNRVQSQRLGAGANIAASARGLEGLERLRVVNSAVNKAIKYRDDSRNWGSSDYWASAAETFARGSGDCEDYAIAKMQVLRSLGVPASDLFLVVGNDLSSRAAHAMLVVRSGGQYWVLDNFHDRLLPDTGYGEFRPVITLSTAGRWLHGYKRGTDRTAGLAAGGARSSSSQPGSSLAALIASPGTR
jgi:predicted transglutaminase-like cysteine proteinase